MELRVGGSQKYRQERQEWTDWLIAVQKMQKLRVKKKCQGLPRVFGAEIFSFHLKKYWPIRKKT
jgi:hypothetical protein